jgi:hypothetical protein
MWAGYPLRAVRIARCRQAMRYSCSCPVPCQLPVGSRYGRLAFLRGPLHGFIEQPTVVICLGKHAHMPTPKWGRRLFKIAHCRHTSTQRNFLDSESSECCALPSPLHGLRPGSLALLWQIYSRRCSLQIHFRQCEHRSGVRAMSFEDGAAHGWQSGLWRWPVD